MEMDVRRKADKPATATTGAWVTRVRSYQSGNKGIGSRRYCLSYHRPDKCRLPLTIRRLHSTEWLSHKKNCVVETVECPRPFAWERPCRPHRQRLLSAYLLAPSKPALLGGKGVAGGHFVQPFPSLDVLNEEIGTKVLHNKRKQKLWVEV